MTVVVGTAGHIDHGKTTLLRALTGIDADRLPEERRRGMTIDVGYAHLELPDGSALDFVDVPGHDRLVGNMLVGAGEIDAALLIVAADDGPRAQTYEHAELLDALGIRYGIAVVTKADVAGPDRTAEVVAAVRSVLAPTSLDRSPVLAVSSTSGQGIDDVRGALTDLRDRVIRDGTRRGSDDTVRLAIDRVFSIRGRGLVVTGSFRGDRLDRGATLRLEPGARTVRARELQVHGHPVESATDGGRVALNVTGSDPAAVERGAVLTTDPAVIGTDRLLVLIRPPVRWDHRSGARPLVRGGTFRLHLGTEAVDARFRHGIRHGTDLVDGRRVATLRLDRPIAAAPGDPFVLRLPSPVATVAAGIVLDASPPRGASLRRVEPATLAEVVGARASGDPAAILGARVALHGIVASSGTRPPLGAQAMGPWLVAQPVVERLEVEALEAVDAHHQREPLSPGMPSAELRRRLGRSVRRALTVDASAADVVAGGTIDGLIATGRLVRAGDVVRDPRRSDGALPIEVTSAMARLEDLLDVPAPPSLRAAILRAGCPPEGVRALQSSGRIVRLDDDLAWASPTYQRLEAVAVDLADPGPLTPAALRDATGTSRKYVMALLEDLDRRGILRRTADGHVRGPRAAATLPAAD